MSIIGTWFDTSPNKDIFKRTLKNGKKRKKKPKKG